jgi:hypothetical protein
VLLDISQKIPLSFIIIINLFTCAYIVWVISPPYLHASPPSIPHPTSLPGDFFIFKKKKVSEKVLPLEKEVRYRKKVTASSSVLI